MTGPNRLLRGARERTPSRRVPNTRMSRAELAEAVNAWLYQNTNHAGVLDAHYVGRLERGLVRWPGNDYRAGFRAVLGVRTDEQLGFLPPGPRRAPDEPPGTSRGARAEGEPPVPDVPLR